MSNMRLGLESFEARRDNLDKNIRNLLVQYDTKVKDYEYPFIVIFGGSLNSNSMQHLLNGQEQSETERRRIHEELRYCHSEQTKECMDSFQKLLVKGDEWYDYFKIHKKKRINYFSDSLRMSSFAKKFDLSNVYEETISFPPSYKYDENGTLVDSVVPSYADRLFYSYTQGLKNGNKLNVIHYESFQLNSMNTAHKGIQMAIKVKPEKREQIKTEEL